MGPVWRDFTVFVFIAVVAYFVVFVVASVVVSYVVVDSYDHDVGCFTIKLNMLRYSLSFDIISVKIIFFSLPPPPFPPQVVSTPN